MTDRTSNLVAAALEFRRGAIHAIASANCITIDANDVESGDDAEVCLDMKEARAFHQWLGAVLGAGETAVPTDVRQELGEIAALLRQDYPNTAHDRLRALLKRIATTEAVASVTRIAAPDPADKGAPGHHDSKGVDQHQPQVDGMESTAALNSVRPAEGCSPGGRGSDETSAPTKLGEFASLDGNPHLAMQNSLMQLRVPFETRTVLAQAGNMLIELGEALRYERACLAELRKRTAETSVRTPKEGDEVVLHFQLSERAGGIRPSQDGWRISEVRRSTYYFLKHPDGSVISLIPGQFSVKASARTDVFDDYQGCNSGIDTTSASTGDTPPAPTSPVECPKCRTQLAFDDDECGLCAEES